MSTPENELTTVLRQEITSLREKGESMQRKLVSA